MTMVDAQRTIDDIFALYERYGSNDYIGEPVSQIEHMSQSAELAIKEGFDNEVILAAFFHDIGHICISYREDNSMSGLGTKNHEKVGADFLRTNGFPERVARLVENHVQAKRYLTFKYPDYYNRLSEASKKTLELQGGKMTQEESESFEKDPEFGASIRLRQWDELAKEQNTPLIDLAILKIKALEVLTST